MSNELFEKMAQSIIDGEDEIAAKLAQEAIAAGIDPLDAINQGYIKGVNVVGEEFSCGNAFLPELVMAGEAMKAAVEVLEPELARLGSKREMLGTVVIATVEGDIHDIGKTLVGTMMSAAGFEVYDMGVDVPIVDLVSKAREVDADIVGVSALLTTTMTKQRDVIEALDDMGLGDRVKVMVGGAPVTRSWMEEIGADGYSEDAIGAVNVAKELMGKG
ncbi:MAG TPA: corrinoid protein [Anaerolineales bacterium]|nr:corrinoid protein [Anaerolineales bacterium]